MTNLYRRLRYGRPIVVVSGLPRSGTSLAMQMLAAGGLSVVTDGVRKAGEDNPKGYYEDERVKDLHKDDVDRSWLSQSKGKAVKIISFLLKYLPESNNYKVLFMRRDLSEVLASQSEMLRHRGEEDETTDDAMLELWRDHLWKVNYFLKHGSHVDCIDIEYRDAVTQPIEQARRIQDFLSVSLNLDAMARVVDPSLYRNRNDGSRGLS